MTFDATAPAATTRLWMEFGVLYIAAPIVLAVFLPASAMFPVLFGVTVLGAILLHRTAGFRWRDLNTGWSRVSWPHVAAFAAITTLACLAIQLTVLPDRWFALFRMSGWAWLAVMLLYPVLSALPQEIVFRPLFFRRYGPLFSDRRIAILVNASVFSLAHLLYWNPIVAAMTFAGGLTFAWAYEVRGSFPFALILHAVAGNILFTFGTGFLFFTGTVQ